MKLYSTTELLEIIKSNETLKPNDTSFDLKLLFRMARERINDSTISQSMVVEKATGLSGVCRTVWYRKLESKIKNESRRCKCASCKTFPCLSENYTLCVFCELIKCAAEPFTEVVFWQPEKGDGVIGFSSSINPVNTPLQLSNTPVFNPDSIKKKKEVFQFERSDNSALLLRIRNLFDGSLPNRAEMVENAYEKSKKLPVDNAKRKRYSNSSDFDLKKDFAIIDKFTNLIKSTINFEEWKDTSNQIESFYPSSLQEEKQVDNLASNNKYIDSLPDNGECNLFYPTTINVKQEKFQLVAEYFKKEYGLEVLSDFPNSLSCIYGFIYIFRKNDKIESKIQIGETCNFLARVNMYFKEYNDMAEQRLPVRALRKCEMAFIFPLETEDNKNGALAKESKAICRLLDLGFGPLNELLSSDSVTDCRMDRLFNGDRFFSNSKREMQINYKTSRIDTLDKGKSYSCFIDEGNNLIIQSEERIIEKCPFIIRLNQETLESFFPNLPIEVKDMYNLLKRVIGYSKKDCLLRFSSLFQGINNPKKTELSVKNIPNCFIKCFKQVNNLKIIFPNLAGEFKGVDFENAQFMFENANIPLSHLKMNSRLFNTLAIQIKLSNSIFKDSFKITSDGDDEDDENGNDGDDENGDEDDNDEEEMEEGLLKKTKFH